MVARAKGVSADSIKCMALVEAHPLAFQMEEFAWNLREHILGLNLGRWDYMASLIHFNLENPEWVLPDRNTIPHNVAFFQNLRTLMPEICHKHGMLAIGGMTALYPSRDNSKLNARPKNADAHPNLRPVPSGIGKRTLAGTRAAIRTVIRYRNGVLNGRGASLLDGYMEDLATDRIYRLMIAQRMKHADAVEVLDENGQAVRHTAALIHQLFDQELERLQQEGTKAGGEANDEQAAKLREARRLSEEMILRGEFNPA